MTRFRFLPVLASLLTVGWLTGVTLRAHEIVYQGTVLAVDKAKPEAVRIQVKTVDRETKREEDMWFALGKATKVKRGEKTMAFADAKVVRGERIVVIVEHEDDDKIEVKELRLAPSP